jgi:hypothetical protein
MEDMSAILAGNIAETITCNMTGNTAMVGMDNISGKMENMTGAMDETQIGNMTIPMTFNVVGKVVIVKDLGNMTEKALIIGEMENMPGKVVIFGKMDKMGVMAARDNMSAENMPAGMAEKLQNMTIVKVGTMTGTMTGNMTRNMENMPGMAEGMENMSGRMENMTVLMAGDMTGTITCDLTGKMVIVKNIGSMDEIAEKMCNMSGRMENMSGSTENISGRMENMTGSMCNMTGNMIILKDMGDMIGTAEKIDATTEMTKIMDHLSLMDGSMVILTDRATDRRMEDKNITRVFENRNNTIGEMAIIRNMDDTTQIMTKTFTCNMTGNTTTIQNMEGMAGEMGSM